MRTLSTAAFVSLDGVMQAPGSPREDSSGGFRYGGWTTPYPDEVVGRGTAENFGRPYDLLLGRKTYDPRSPRPARAPTTTPRRTSLSSR